MISPEQDLRARWRPTETAVQHAKALLDAEPRADLAVIPMIQPGKIYGIWETGQPVETVAGAVFIGINSHQANDDEVPTFGRARDAATILARARLADRPGTVAYAIVHRDGAWAVFEDLAGPKDEER